MEQEKIHVLRRKPGAAAYEMICIDNNLDAFQTQVGGYIEVHPFNGDGLVVVCDEEGKLKRKGFTAMINGQKYVGTILIAATDKDGNFKDMEAWMWS